MQISTNMVSLVTKAIAESLDLHMIQFIAEQTIHNYDFHRQTGISNTINIPRAVAAKQFVRDARKEGLFLKLIQTLVDIHTSGYMGKNYPVKHLRPVIIELKNMGIIYDQTNRVFVEDSGIRRTKNWGTILPGEEHTFALLRLDIVGNSKLVREYPEEIIKKTYTDLRKIVQDATDKREGRIWSWEGDGGLIAFFFSNKNLYASLAGMDIINRLFVYNHTNCRLNKPLEVRIAVHSGIMEYVNNEEDLKSVDLVKKVVNIEANYTKPNTLTVSDMAMTVFGKHMLDQFSPTRGESSKTYYSYSVNWERTK